ncbi:fungal-specific transcription factor domain-containing protein [Peziza echinospora]|nr:fungal-specific transcription factor domain-containing protein [Peziza echinospora]
MGREGKRDTLMRVDMDIDTRRPHDGPSISRSILQDLPQKHQHPLSVPTGVHPQSHPRNPPTTQLPESAPTQSSAEAGSNSASYKFHLNQQPQSQQQQPQQQQQQQHQQQHQNHAHSHHQQQQHNQQLQQHHQQQQQLQQQQQQKQSTAEEQPRGRERDRERESGSMDTPTHGNGSSAETSSRKRRRSRKGLDKKFECSHLGCGRTYSRAEHLYRHQLNHQPKGIYLCEFQGCKRSFVRQDLCARHRERHTNKAAPQGRSSFMGTPGSTSGLEGKDAMKESSSPESTMKEEDDSHLLSPISAQASISVSRGVTVSSDISTTAHSVSSSNDNPGNLKTENRSKMRRTTADHEAAARSLSMSIESPNDATGRRFSMDPSASLRKFSRPSIKTASVQTPNMNALTLASPYSATAPSSAHTFPSTVASSGSNSAPITNTSRFVPQTGLVPFTLPPPEFPMTQTSGINIPSTSPPTSSSSMDGMGTSMIGSTTGLDLDYTAGYAVPVFGGDGFHRSPHTVTDDWATWFFSEESGSIGRGTIPASAFIDQPQTPQGYYPSDMNSGSLYHPSVNHPMSVTSIIAPPGKSDYVHNPPRDSIISEVKRSELMDLINGNNFLIRPLSIYMTDPPPDDEGLLSLSMMQQYISNYWIHFHPQLPILHKATFLADRTANYLLLTIMTIGASCLDHRQEPTLAAAAGELAKDLAWNLRWCIFSDNEFKPPAKLWVFQALILLETYEKMYSTRQLHERAHIHHATTLTLMRRGSSLTGRPADSPASHRDGSGHPGSLNSTTDEWWNKWIQSEATKRAAFAAFVLDSTHATMFGHSATMVAHEIQLSLPCDEGLWAATSANEALRMEQTLSTVGVRPISFLEGLKRTLNGQKVQTNTFGRTVLMAGLLSVSYHMNQRDLQVTAVGSAAQFGNKSLWRSSLTRAFDYWKKDFDESLKRAKLTSTSTGTGPFEVDYFLPNTEDVEHESTFESRIVLHHLAHMAMHVDIVDLQIYAGASRLLGKAIGPTDYTGAQRRMREWAPTARARDATFYALRFLSQVLLPEERLGVPLDEDESAAMGPTRRTSNATATTGVPVYSARDDHLLNRPWVLYFATLIVWSYGYALDGPLTQPVQTPLSPQESYAHMRRFLRTVGGVSSPADLAKIRGRNDCLGLMSTLAEMFVQTRWELMGEAAKLLNTGINILTGRN